MSAHDEVYIEMFQPKLPEPGDIVTISWEWNDHIGATVSLKKIIKNISEGHLPDHLEARPLLALPSVSIDVTPKQKPMVLLDEEGRPELIERN